MFTGIVERLGVISRIEALPTGYRLRIDLGRPCEEVEIGDSVAINGCCLTVVGIYDQILAFDAGVETWSRTTFRKLQAGSKINTETAVKAGEPLGGHFVTGHIDGPGKLIGRKDDDDWSTFVFEAPPSLVKQMVSKGSIAIDGVSLTVVDVDESTFSVALIPHTLAVTTLGQLKVGDEVNLETDILAKYVERQLSGSLPSSNPTPTTPDR